MRDTWSPSGGQEVDVGRIVTRVFYADGERTSTGTVQAALHQLRAEVTHFDNVKDCLDSLRNKECHLLISNARRPAVDGVRLLLGAKRVAPSVPVVLLVDQGDIRVAVRAIKGGAIDCLERPPEKAHLVSAIDAVLQGEIKNILLQKDPLTKTEDRVLRLILQGHTTAETGRRLHRSRRTVEVHRCHIMRKLEVHSMVDLVRRCARMGLLQDWP